MKNIYTSSGVSAYNGDSAVLPGGGRGTVGIVYDAGWGAPGEVTLYSRDSFIPGRYIKETFACDIDDQSLDGIRDVLANASTVAVFRPSGGTVASCSLGQARYPGARGNSIRLAVYSHNGGLYRVVTYLHSEAVDSQIVSSAAELKDNAFVIFNRDAVIFEKAGLPLTGGTDAAPDEFDFVAGIEALLAHPINIDILAYADDSLSHAEACISAVRREREAGRYVKCVLFRYFGDGSAFVTSVYNEDSYGGGGVVYYTAGLCASSYPWETLAGKNYAGSFGIRADFSDEDCIRLADAGQLVYQNHKGIPPRIFRDVNTAASEQNCMLSDNSSMRLYDYIISNIRIIFNDKYADVVYDDVSGCSALADEITSFLSQLSHKYGAIRNDTISTDATTDGAGAITVSLSVSPLLRPYDIGVSVFLV